MRTFFEQYGDLSLQQLFSDWQSKPLDLTTSDWLNFPPESFLLWARSFPRHPFDGIPPATHHKQSPSFLLSQTHRIWLSAKLVADHCGLEGNLVDFGSFPFSVPLALRDCFGYRGAIIGTAIQPLSSESLAILDSYRVQIAMLDLDPYVVDPTRSEPPPMSLAIEPGTVDVVTMFHVIEHLYHPMTALREASRILKPGGRLIITTDNAMMLNTLLNYVSGYGYIFEPVASTAAMTVHDWRGHVRFFTADDLQTMAQAAGFSTASIGFEEVFYDIFHEDYFADPNPYMSGSKQAILFANRQFANDVYLIATKE